MVRKEEGYPANIISTTSSQAILPTMLTFGTIVCMEGVGCWEKSNAVFCCSARSHLGGSDSVGVSQDVTWGSSMTGIFRILPNWAVNLLTSERFLSISLQPPLNSS